MIRLVTCLLLLPISAVFAELPPSAYEKMQNQAPEVLRVHVLRVDPSQGKAPDTREVTMLAEVLKVGRSKSRLKPGDMITVKYEVVSRQPGWTGPGEVPILKQDLETVAYLAPAGSTLEYVPAAGAMSFDRF